MTYLASRMMKLPEVLAVTAKGRSATYEEIKRGEFPAPKRIGKRSVAWLSDEVEAWIAARPVAE